MITQKNPTLALKSRLGIALILCLVPIAAAQSSCVNPNRKIGSCISIYDCPALLEVVQKLELTPLLRDFLQKSQCLDGVGRQPFVCCTSDKGYTGRITTTASPATVNTPPTTVSASPSNGRGNVLPQPPACGPNTLADKIYNGNDTALDQYPWMVLLEYKDKSGQPRLECGGSLINQRYVLTAAHCVQGAIEQQVGQLSRVRLGEYDINSEIDCILDDCNNKVLEVGVEEVVPHPQFSMSGKDRHHDIALIRLNADVTYTDFIRPVCLPLASSRTAVDVGEQLVVAGWGRTLLARQSNVKKQLAVPVVDHDACVQKFAKLNVNLIMSQLCAGGEFARDSCDGDSGGPLMRQGNQQQNSRWYLEGIVSFGNRCGLESWPGVYTRVADYADWIQQNIKP